MLKLRLPKYPDFFDSKRVKKGFVWLTGWLIGSSKHIYPSNCLPSPRFSWSTFIYLWIQNTNFLSSVKHCIFFYHNSSWNFQLKEVVRKSRKSLEKSKSLKVVNKKKTIHFFWSFHDQPAHVCMYACGSVAE